MSGPGWRGEAWEGALADPGQARFGPEAGAFCWWLSFRSFRSLLALTLRSTQRGALGTLVALHNVDEDVGLTEEGAAGVRGNTKVGLAKRLWGETGGLATGKGRSGADC